MMTVRVIALTLLAGSLLLVASFAIAGPMQEKEFSQAVEFEAGGKLTIKTDKGSVRLTSWNQNMVDIVAHVAPPEDVTPDYARAAVEATKIDVSGSGRNLSIRTNFEDVPYKDAFTRSRTLPNVHYEIRAPRSLNLDLDVDRCKVELQGIEGRFALNTDRTTVKATDLVGDINLQIDRGEVTFSRVGGKFAVEADRTNIDLQAVRIDGDSRFELDRGEMRLKVPESQGLTIATDISRRGTFDSDFAISSTQTRRDKNFEGTINGGGPRLSFRTDRGKIRLIRE